MSTRHANQNGPASRWRTTPLPDQKIAEANMAAAGIKPPRACGCVNPAYHTDYEGDTSCVFCGRAPRGRS